MVCCFGGVVVLELLGVLFIGIGIVFGIVGFGWFLYVFYMEDDFNDMFLK